MLRSAPQSHCAFFFFQNRDLHNQTKSFFFSLCHIGAFCHLQSSIGKPEIRKPINPVFPVYLNCAEVQGQFPTEPARTLHISQVFLSLKCNF